MRLEGWLGSLVVGVALLAPASVSAKLVYKYEAGLLGDSGWAADINDNGEILWTGSCDARCRIWTPFLQEPAGASGMLGTDINNAGDVLGEVLTSGQRVPTLWKQGVPYDLTDPANAKLRFQYDPGPKYAPFDLLSLDVVNLPAIFRPTWCDSCPTPWPDQGYGENYLPPLARVDASALTNARGDWVFGYDAVVPDRYGVLRVIGVVPEPPMPALISLALAAALCASRSNRTPRPPRGMRGAEPR
jgi:hypothetical protein